MAFHSYATLNHLFVAGTGKSVPAEYNTPGHISEAVVRRHRESQGVPTAQPWDSRAFRHILARGRTPRSFGKELHPMVIPRA